MKVQQVIDAFDIDADITTPIYPCSDGGLDQLIGAFAQTAKDWIADNKIIVSAANFDWAEINLLFQYHKIYKKNYPDLSAFARNNNVAASKWNASYTGWQDMQAWELREWFSLFYVPWIQEWMQPSDLPGCHDFLRVTNRDIITNPMTTMLRIIEWCGLTPNDQLSEFMAAYVRGQQYILDEWNVIDMAVRSVIDGQEQSWTKISPVGEAIIQRRLRAHGLEIRCDGLDIFPTSSVELQKLTYLSKQPIQS